MAGNRDRELDDPRGYGLIEYAYHLMARAGGIEMTECRVLHENGRHHFMTRRFDRTDTGGKIHMQSARCAGPLRLQPARRVFVRTGPARHRAARAGQGSGEEQFRRLAFNVVARNQDDHVKNIAFLMDRSGRWRLSPAFDATYSYNPGGRWTNAHQMTLNGKRDGFEVSDFVACARNASLKRGRAAAILGEVQEAVSRWPEFAEAAGVPEHSARRIGAVHRTDLLP